MLSRRTRSEGFGCCGLGCADGCRAGIDFPVNLLMCFEGMEEYGSEGLDDLIREEADKYFKDAEAVCISDN